MHLQMENTSILHRHLGAVVVSVHNHHIIIYWFYTFAKGEYKYITQAPCCPLYGDNVFE